MYSPSDVIESTAHALGFGSSISGACSLYSEFAYCHPGLPWQPQLPTTPTGYQGWNSYQPYSSSRPLCVYDNGASSSVGRGFLVGDGSHSSGASTMAEQPVMSYAGVRSFLHRDDTALTQIHSDSTTFDCEQRGSTLSSTSGVFEVTRPQFPACRYFSAQAQSRGSGWENHWSDADSYSNSSCATTMRPPFDSRLPVYDDVTTTPRDNVLGNIINFKTEPSTVRSNSFWTSLETDAVHQTPVCHLMPANQQLRTPVTHVNYTPALPVLAQRETPKAPKSSNRSPTLFSPHTVAVLTAWYEANSEHPYPDSDEVAQLTRDAGIKASQLRRWFANRRQRSANTKHIREIALRRRQRKQVG